MKYNLEHINYVDVGVRKLMRLNEPVIIWGLDIFALAILLHLKDMSNIVGIYSKNPIFFGCCINGVRVDNNLYITGGRLLNLTKKNINGVLHINDLEWGKSDKPYVRGNW